MRNIRYVTLLYLATLLLGTVLPLGSRISYTLSNNYVLQIRWDYLIHFFLYLPMPVLLGLSFLKRTNRISSGASTGLTAYWFIVAGGSLLLTFLYEALQLAIPYRYFNINDMAANMVGVFAGLILLVTFPSALRQLQTRYFPGPSH